MPPKILHLSSTAGNTVILANPYFSWLFSICFAWILAAAPVRSTADLIPESSVTLEWDANSEPDVAGYKLYFGTVSGTYGETFDAGNLTVATVQVVPGVTYFFAVTAYNAVGLESTFSNEVTFTVPEVPELVIENIEPPAGSATEDGHPAIGDPVMLPGGILSFTVTAPAGQRLEVEVSSDLISWTCRGILENPTGGIIVNDPDASAHRMRFYRVAYAAAE